MNPQQHLRDRFAHEYGMQPQWTARAPGRINLIGEHTDYNEGLVLPMAIERDILIAAALNGTSTIQLRSTASVKPSVIQLRDPVHPEPLTHWTNYPRGVVAGFLERDQPLPGIDLLVHSNLPPGLGLSSSAALCVATATLLEAVTGLPLAPLDKIRLCQQTELRFAGVPCGIMDPFISTLGRRDQFLKLDCRSLESQAIPFEDPEVAILIISTNVRHKLAHSEYPLRRAQCQHAAFQLNASSLREVSLTDLLDTNTELDPVSLKRARHVVGEIERTELAAEALGERRWPALGELLYASHESLRVDFEVSCAELDTVVNIARDIGVAGGIYGCRMTGGGFGGCAIALIQTGAALTVRQRIGEEYRRVTDRAPSFLTSRPASGTGTLQ